jgi:class 3 adenylate cyclase
MSAVEACPETRYASTEGSYIAYEVEGCGPPDLLVMSGEFVPVDAMHEEPRYAACLHRLATFSRVIRFDRRGTGLSEPVSASAPTTVEEWAGDALIVLDAVGCEKAAVFASTDAGLAGLALAATHPERIERLVLLHGYARTAWAADFPVGAVPEASRTAVDIVTDPTGTNSSFDLLSLLAPSVCEDRQFRGWWDRAGHRGASPAVARAMWRALVETDVRHTLGAIHVPTLVLQRSDNRWTKAEHSHYLASHIEGARLAMLPGADDLWWVGNTDELLCEIEEFLTGRRPALEPNRVLATVVFTDIVASTERAAAAGDRSWRELLVRHNEIVRRQLQRYGGREVTTTGDGFLATFDGPARAINCACAIQAAVRALDIELRIGVHTGEIEIIGDDIGGIAVHIGSRILALAQPGEVLVSGSVPPLVAGSNIEFHDRGDRQLEGVPGTWRLFSVQS